MGDVAASGGYYIAGEQALLNLNYPRQVSATEHAPVTGACPAWR
jgi:hypothetical protein